MAVRALLHDCFKQRIDFDSPDTLMLSFKQNAILPVMLCNLIGAALSFGLNAAFVINLKMGVRY